MAQSFDWPRIFRPRPARPFRSAKIFACRQPRSTRKQLSRCGTWATHKSAQKGLLLEASRAIWTGANPPATPGPSPRRSNRHFAGLCGFSGPRRVVTLGTLRRTGPVLCGARHAGQNHAQRLQPFWTADGEAAQKRSAFRRQEHLVFA